MRAAPGFALLAAATVACGGGGGSDDGDGPCTDCDAAIDPDALNNEAFTWRLEPRDATTLYRYEDEEPIVQGRSTRIAVEHPRLACDLIAMPQVDIDAGAGTVLITPRIFVRTPACPLTSGSTRVVTLALAAGTWTIHAAGTSTTVTLTVGPPPGRACGQSPCTLDCDCDVAAGERCLGAMGFGGPFLGCARPCEHDRDCGGTGACVDIADGHFHTCDPQPECTATYPCPTGFDCAPDRVCDPTFTLTAGTRHECASDVDCLIGMGCVEPTSPPGGPSRCEAMCRTGGAWCQGAHVCGPASADVGNLARSDSVCGFLGD